MLIVSFLPRDAVFFPSQTLSFAFSFFFFFLNLEGRGMKGPEGLREKEKEGRLFLVICPWPPQSVGMFLYYSLAPMLSVNLILVGCTTAQVILKYVLPRDERLAL